MRTRPLVGRKAWFGPRRLGWGLPPVSPEGWAVTAVAVVAIVCIAGLARHGERWLVLVVIAAMLAVTFLKGTSPGGSQQ
jgi:hypothetical protein